MVMTPSNSLRPSSACKTFILDQSPSGRTESRRKGPEAAPQERQPQGLATHVDFVRNHHQELFQTAPPSPGLERIPDGGSQPLQWTEGIRGAPSCPARVRTVLPCVHVSFHQTQSGVCLHSSFAAPRAQPGFKARANASMTLRLSTSVTLLEDSSRRLCLIVLDFHSLLSSRGQLVALHFSDLAPLNSSMTAPRKSCAWG